MALFSTSYDLNNLTDAEDAKQINYLFIFILFFTGWLFVQFLETEDTKWWHFPWVWTHHQWCGQRVAFAAGQDSGTPSFILTHIIHADIKLFRAKCCVFLGKKEITGGVKNVRRLVGGCRRCARSYNTIHTGSITILKVTPTSQIKLSYSSFVSRLA